MDFHQGDGALRLPGLIGPFHRKARDGGEGVEQLRMAVSHEIGHFAAIGHARHEDVVLADVMRPDDMLHQRLDKAHIIAREPLLDIIAHIPAVLSLRILLPLRIADGKALALSHFQHGRAIAFGRAAVTVEYEDKRGGGLRAFRNIQPVGPHLAFIFHGEADRFRRQGRKPGGQQQNNKQETFHCHQIIIAWPRSGSRGFRGGRRSWRWHR